MRELPKIGDDVNGNDAHENVNELKECAEGRMSWNWSWRRAEAAGCSSSFGFVKS